MSEWCRKYGNFAPNAQGRFIEGSLQYNGKKGKTQKKHRTQITFENNGVELGEQTFSS